MTDSEPAVSIIHNVPCTACGCVCDDLSVSVSDNRIVGIERACPIARDWFTVNSQTDRAVAEIDGQPSDLQAALTRAARILHSADAPLVYGLSRSNTAGQRAAVRLAELVGATIDTTASQCHGPSIMAIQEMGESTCTLGEIRNRADLVIYWGCHPAETHPRHAERYAVFPCGTRVPGGRADRTVVLIGPAGEVENWRLDRNGATADVVIPIAPHSDFEVLTRLLALVRGWPNLTDETDSPGPAVDTVRPSRRAARLARQPEILATAEPECDRADLAALAARMIGCQCGVVFFGLGLTGMVTARDPENPMPGQHNVHLLLKLVAELNAQTRFFARRMRIYGDVTGADNVLCWHTGYPFSVNLSRGYPRYNPGEYSADSVLARAEADACLLVGSETFDLLSPAAQAHLRRIPTIAIDNPGTALPFSPTVRITTAPCGVSVAGTVYRMDGVPFELRTVLTSDYPSDDEILDRLCRLVMTHRVAPDRGPLVAQ